MLYGRAHRSHRWGHRFESCCDHHSPSENTVFGRIFYIIHTKATHSRPEIAKKGGFSSSDFRDFFDFWHSDSAVAFDELLNAAAESDGSSDVVFWEVVAAPEDGDEPESFFITLNPDDQLKSGVPFRLTIYAGVMFK